MLSQEIKQLSIENNGKNQGDKLVKYNKNHSPLKLISKVKNSKIKIKALILQILM